MKQTIKSEEINLDSWLNEETFEAAVEMMKSEAVVHFGTAMWPI
ncbi:MULTISPECIES: hypothetical protein [Aeromonas]|nr:hypothetical protein [Aeromonas salmonicida]MDR7021055.1 hypothetical protein [Aeromonas salmonicida]WVM47180.1 hypothetical protein V0242_09170 [Aeromonas hydrophila]